MPLLFILTRVRLPLLGVVTREQLDEFVFVDPYLLDRPVREIEHDVEDFQLVVRRSGGRPWAGVEPKAARTRGRITRCREDRLAGLEIRVFNGRRVVVVDA
jgi:hypothetical protein